jgi:hypothetical protein
MARWTLHLIPPPSGSGDPCASVHVTVMDKQLGNLKTSTIRAQPDWTLTHTNHKDTEQSTIEAFITIEGVTRTDSLLR